MTPERYQQIGEMYHAALELAPEYRAAFLAQTCIGDEALLREVESLIAANDEAGNFINAPALEVAAELLGKNKERLLPGKLLGPYKILELLGSGGMGEVYLAQDSRLCRNVALKLLPAHFVTNEDRLHRFQKEARAASALNHPNIITIHEIGETETAHYLVLELIEGDTLRALLSSRRLELVRAVDIAIQTASALAAAHAAGIVHRDIKPENIMIRRDDYVKVLDFGIAKLIEGSECLAPKTCLSVETSPGLVIGTTHYMSPEQAQGLEVDERTDIWSLGVVLFEMVTGQLPFKGKTPSHTIVSIVEHELPPLVNEREVPAALERILTRALKKSPDERYATIKDLLADLKTLHRELDSGVRANPTQYWTSAIVALVVLFTMLAGVAYFTRGRKQSINSLAILPFVNSSPDPNTYHLSEGTARRHTINVEAHQSYLKGRYHWNKRTPDGLKKRIEYFNEAIEKDPAYGQAYAGIADSYNTLARFNLLRPQEAYPKARAAATKALEIDETLSEAHASLAVVKMDYEWDLPGAEREFKRAITLNHGYPGAHQWYALLLAARGQTGDALAEMKRAHDLDPLSLIIDMGLGGLYIYARQYDQAIAHFEKTRELHPEAFQPDSNLAYVYEIKGMKDEAVAAYLKSRTLAGDSAERVSAFKTTYAVSGWKGYLERRVDEMKAQARLKYVSPFSIALVYAQMGEKTQALTWLEKTYEERNYRLLFIRIDPRLDSLRSEPRFIDLMKRIDESCESAKSARAFPAIYSPVGLQSLRAG